MRSFVLGAVMATGMSVLVLSAASAPRSRAMCIVGQGVIEQAQYDSRYCRRLRRALSVQRCSWRSR